MTISRRLMLLLFVPLACLVGLFTINFLTAASLEARTRLLADTQIESLAEVGRFSRILGDRSINLRNCIISEDPDECSRARAAFAANEDVLSSLLRHYAGALISSEEDARLVGEIEKLTAEWNTRANGVLVQLDAGNRGQAIDSLNKDVVPLGSELKVITEEWSSLNAKIGHDLGASVLRSFEQARLRAIIFGCSTILLTGIFGVIVARSIVRPIAGLEGAVETIAKGHFNHSVPFTTGRDEIGALARSVDVLRKGAGSAQRQGWVKETVSRIATEIQGAESTDEFGRRLLSNLTPLIGGGVSAFYVTDTQAGTDAGTLRRAATFGITDVDSPATFRFGSGLAGQCASERKPITLSELPPDYLRVSSGLGGAAPTFVAAWPLLVQQVPVGVIEFASFRELDAQQSALIEDLLPVVALSLDVLNRGLHTKELLEESRRQAETLASQQATLNRINYQADTALDLTKAGYWHVPLDDSGWYNSSERAANIFGDLPSPGFRYRLDEWASHVREGDEAAAKTTMENFAAAVAGTIPVYNATYAYKRPVDGRVVWIHALGHVMKDESGKPTDMFGVTQDVTEFKRLESELRQTMQKAEEATVAKSSFLANMSHEIRTPMNGIMGMTELALDTELTAEQRDYLNTVKSSADALLSLINDILDFSKIEAGRIELDPIEFLLRDSISDTLSPLALRAASKGVELAYDVHPDVPDALIGDIYRLRQIIVNLAGNAIKFTERGEVVISVRTSARQGDDVSLEIAVRDTGIGITPEAAARLFKAFEQAESSTTRKYGGTGLGLAISKQLVELMGGQIRLDSIPGTGSTFIFTVRFKVGTARPSTSSEDAAKVLAGKCVLIVDDNETNRRILTAMLGNWGLRVVQSDSGSSALTALDRTASAGQPISLIITDLHMPEMDGFELTRAIRDHPRFGTVPIMLLTSSASMGDQSISVELGVAARLLKPVKQSLLLDNIMRVLGMTDRSRAATVADAAPSAAPQAVRSLRVLLAEDNAVNQKFAVRVLSGAGHDVVVANNGREAVEHWSSKPFDLVLMDVQMPEMDGLEATRQIRDRESGTGRRTAIVAMTANAMVGDREMCLQAGMDGYVAKPVKRELLFAEVARVLTNVQGGADRGEVV